MKPGLHSGVKMGDYLALEAVSAGLLHTVLTHSPAHARHEQKTPADDATEGSDTGTAIHSALLEGLDIIVACPFDDWRKNAAKEMRDDARAQGKIPILEHKVPALTGAVRAASEFIVSSELAGIFDSGKPEQTAVWEEAGDIRGGAMFGPMRGKARPDWLNLNMHTCLHVKTTKGSAQPDAWIRNQLVPMGYDISAVWYERGIAALGKSVKSVFLVIEQEAPHGCSLVELADWQHDIAAGKVEAALAMWSKCVQSGNYPMYPSRITRAPEPIGWQIMEAERRGWIKDGLSWRDGMDPEQQKHGLQA